MQMLNVIDDLFQSGADGVAAVTGIFAVKGIEYCKVFLS